MKIHLPSFLQDLIRTVITITLILLGFYLISQAEEGFGSMAMILIAMACFTTGAFIIASPIARFISKPSGSLFYPKDELVTFPMYRIAESLTEKGLYREAIKEYWRISEKHPDEIKPYVEMIKISVHHLKDFDMAIDIWNKGVSALKGKHEEKVLSGMLPEIELITKEKHVLDAFDSAMNTLKNKS